MDYTSRERVLIHLYLRRIKEGTGGSSHQELISRECGVGRTHVPRVIRPLMADNLVEESSGRAPGHIRRVKTYSLTGKGEGVASEIMDGLRERRLEWEGPDDQKRIEHLTDALLHMNDELGPLGLSVTVPGLMRLGDRVSWSELKELAGSVAVEKGVDLPPGWISIEGVSVPDPFLGREKEVEEVHSLIRSQNYVVLSGKAGMGKRTLIGRIAQLKGLRVLWLRRGKGEKGAVNVPVPDLIALKDDVGPDVLAQFMQGVQDRIEDPRDDGWQDELRSAPLIRVIDGPLEGSSYVLKGLGEKEFVRSCTRAGLDESLARMLHAASGGPPSLISYLNSLDRDELVEILRGEDPIFRLILGMRRA